MHITLFLQCCIESTSWTWTNRIMYVLLFICSALLKEKLRQLHVLQQYFRPTTAHSCIRFTILSSQKPLNLTGFRPCCSSSGACEHLKLINKLLQYINQSFQSIIVLLYRGAVISKILTQWFLKYYCKFNTTVCKFGLNYNNSTVMYGMENVKIHVVSEVGRVYKTNKHVN